MEHRLRRADEDGGGAPGDVGRAIDRLQSRAAQFHLDQGAKFRTKVVIARAAAQRARGPPAECLRPLPPAAGTGRLGTGAQHDQQPIIIVQMMLNVHYHQDWSPRQEPRKSQKAWPSLRRLRQHRRNRGSRLQSPLPRPFGPPVEARP
jgi:hypothetical protein